MADRPPLSSFMQKKPSLESFASQSETQTQAEPSVSQRLEKGLASILGFLTATAKRQMQSGPTSFENLTGGPAQAFAQEAKREALSRVMPGEGIVPNAFKEALVQGTYGGNILAAGANPTYTPSGTLESLGLKAPISLNVSALKPIIKDFFSSGGQLKKINAELEEMPLRRLELTTQKKNIATQKTQDLASLTQEFGQNKKLADKAIADEANLQSATNKSRLKTVFKNMTTTYRQGLDQAEQALATSGKSLTKGDYLQNVLLPTIDEMEGRGISPENPLYEQFNKLIQTVQEQKGDTIPLGNMKNLRNLIYDTISKGAREGTEYFSQADELANLYLKNHGAYLEQMSPELAQLNAEFVPMAQARRWAMKNFRPFNLQEITKGADILRKVATSERPSMTDLNYLKTLEQGSGRFQGAGSLRGQTTSIGQEAKQLATSFAKAKVNLADSIDYRIHQIETQLADISGSKIRLGYRQKELTNLRNARRAIGLIALGETFPGVRKATRSVLGI